MNEEMTYVMNVEQFVAFEEERLERFIDYAKNNLNKYKFELMWSHDEWIEKYFDFINQNPQFLKEYFENKNETAGE